METNKVITSEVEGFEFGFVDGEEWVPFTDETIKEFCKSGKSMEALMEAIKTSLSYLQEDLNHDLRDIWKRLDKTENL